VPLHKRQLGLPPQNDSLELPGEKGRQPAIIFGKPRVQGDVGCFCANSDGSPHENELLLWVFRAIRLDPLPQERWCLSLVNFAEPNSPVKVL
jgi:hypothetical protein